MLAKVYWNFEDLAPPIGSFIFFGERAVESGLIF